ncbi:MAG: beta-galactosidase [Lachnospiraceae bacterium]|nr:beta-galactosidase [Lachnospiraceae bacterium]
MENKFLFGAVYIIEQDYTDEEMRRDLTNMRDCGFNLVTLWPVNNAWLAKTSREWVFDKTRYVMDICLELGMQVILQLFGQNQSQEFMPDWAATPEMEYQDGGFGPNGNCMWANLNHPAVREHMDTYFREAIIALKDHPALYGWDVFNEAHFKSDDPWTTGLYQNWLKEKYGSIEKLNKEWYRRYESFEQIRPEKRRAPYSIWSSLLPSIEYEKFRSVNVTEICRFLYDTARKYDDRHPIMVDGTSSAIVSGDVTARNNDEFETAKIPDIYGATFYPKSWGKNYKETPWTLSMYFAIPAGAAREQGKPYFVNELQTHTQSVLTPGSEVSCEELVSWNLMCIFTGAGGMQLWRWRPFLHGYQATGRGLTLMDGTPNERAAAVAEMLQVVQANGALFDQFQISAPAVKILCSYDVRLYFDSLLKFGENGRSFWADNLEGWYKLFWNWGMPAEFSDLSNVSEKEVNAPIAVLPGAVRVSKEEAAGLKRYVENGGILIADGRMAAINELACVPPEGIPGRTLSELFGVIEIDVDSGRDMLVAGSRIPTGHQSQKLKVISEKAEVLAVMEDGSPAVVVHPVGKGKAIYFNSFTGLVLYEKLHKQLQDIIGSQIEKVDGIRADKDEHVHISYIESEHQKAVLIINSGKKPEEVILRGLPTNVEMKDIFSGAVLTTSRETRIAIDQESHSVYVYDK